MKRSVKVDLIWRVWFSIIGFFILVAFVSADCNPDQVMFRLYQNTNSHAALWNQTIYTIPFCYNDSFGTYTGANPHVCTGTNTLFYLIAENNSHVSNSSIGGYGVPVCYGDLECSVVLGACSSGFKNISRLYNYTNSHISNLTDTNYPYYLCCKKSGAVFSADLKWKDLVGTDISSANISDDVVLFFAQPNVNFSIVNAQTGSILYSGESSEQYQVREVGPGIYFFNVTTSSGSLLYSNNLTVSGIEDSIPAPLLLSPLKSVLGQRYSVGSQIPFTQNSTDKDDLLNISWDFMNGSGSKVSFYNYSIFDKFLKGTSLGDINKSYSVQGVYDVILASSEKRRALSTHDYTRVVVLAEGINVIPIITSPERGITTNATTFFNASQTYVVNCSASLSSPDFITNDGNLRCKYLHAPGSNRGVNLPSVPKPYSLVFNWTMDDGRSIVKAWNSTNYYGVVEFIYRFSETGQHLSKLSVTYNA